VEKAEESEAVDDATEEALDSLDDL